MTNPLAPVTLEELLYRAALDREATQARKAVSDYFTIDQAAVALHATYWAFYGAIQRHNVPVRRVGKSITVHLIDLQPYFR